MTSSRPTDLMIKCMASFIENGDFVYHGLDSILPVLSMVYAAKYIRRDFIWHSVAEPWMPDLSKIVVRPSTGPRPSGSSPP